MAARVDASTAEDDHGADRLRPEVQLVSNVRCEMMSNLDHAEQRYRRHKFQLDAD
jgi:hypothetical protein